jgi:SNF2 family DNA or RNA helicase
MKILLAQGSAGLFLDPGLGKTSVVLAAYRILREEGYTSKGMLIVAPLRVCHNVWPAEVEKWSNFHDVTIEVLHGKYKAEALERDADIHIINPEGLSWLFDEKARRWRDWDIICVDESTKFKDSQTKRFKLMRKHFEHFTRRWILTGTPVPNGIGDLFGQIYILDLGAALGRYITHFRGKYFYTESWEPYKYIAHEWAFNEIVDRIDPLVIRMCAEDYLNMPRLPEIAPVMVELPPKARKIYTEIENDFITRLDEGFVVAANAAVAGGKCRQIANGGLYTNDAHDWIEVHSAKVDALSDILEELGGAPTLVMYEFNHDLKRLLARFGSGTPYLGGGTSSTKADQYIRDFNQGHIPVMLCHPASMAHGLNLQDVCHHIIWFGITWNFEHYDQSIARIYRQGQKNPVFVYHIVCRGTLDETVMEVLKLKDRTQQTLFKALSK